MIHGVTWIGSIALAGLLVAGESGALPFSITLEDQSREVAAEASVVIVDIDSDFDAAMGNAPDFSPYADEVEAHAEVDLDGASGLAFQESEITEFPSLKDPAEGTVGVFALAGVGSTSTFDIFDPGFASSASAGAASRFQLIFTTTGPTPYGIDAFAVASLEDLSIFAGSGSTRMEVLIELSGAASGVIHSLLVVDDTPDGASVEDELFFEGILQAETYTLTASAISEAMGTEDAFGGGFTAGTLVFFAGVPEPTTGLLVAIGMAGLALLPARPRVAA